MDPNHRYVSVKELSKMYGVSTWSIYELIKHEPSFPYRNIGLKRKFVIDPDAFEAWMEKRTKREKALAQRLPTADELLRR